MILSKTVFIKIRNNEISHFESLGYLVPKYKPFQNRNLLRVKRNTCIEVKISDLPMNSRTKVLCKCDDCGKENLVIYQNLKNKFKYLCNTCSLKTSECKEKLSKRCLGKTLSEEHKRKISIGNKGKLSGSKHPLFGKPSPMRGKFGKDNPLFDPSISLEERRKRHSIPKINHWKKEVKERDNYTCQKCGSKEHLQAHHINNFKNFKEQRLLIENGVTLCKDCHKAIHKRFGYFTNADHFLLFCS